MPLTALTTLLGSIIMIGAWALINQRIRNAGGTAPRQSLLLNRFLLQMGIFFLFMFLPHLWLELDPSQFPLYMAWGYVIGHIFMYLAFLSVGRLFISIVPRLVSKEKFFVFVGLIAIAGATVLNANTMVWGIQPAFDSENGVTLFNAHPAIGAIIGIFALMCVMPMAILMIRNGITNPSNRTRSFLLGVGLVLLMLGGPLHDVARSAMIYAIADVVTIIAQVLIASGVAYKLQERIGIARSTSYPSPAR